MTLPCCCHTVTISIWFEHFHKKWGALKWMLNDGYTTNKKIWKQTKGSTFPYWILNMKMIFSIVFGIKTNPPILSMNQTKKVKEMKRGLRTRACQQHPTTRLCDRDSMSFHFFEMRNFLPAELFLVCFDSHRSVFPIHILYFVLFFSAIYFI